MATGVNGGFDPRSAHLRIDPHPSLHRLRQVDPVHWSPVLDALVLTRHDDVSAVSRSPAFGTPREVFIEELAGRLGTGRAFEYTSRRLTFYDNPELTRLRGLALRAFTPSRVERLRPWVRHMTNELFDRAERMAADDGEGVVDLRAAVFHPLPSMVISELLGVPEEDREFFDRANDPLTHLTAPFVTPAQVAAGEESAELEWRRLTELLAERRQHPGDDLVSALLASRDDEGGAFADEELIALLMMLFSAGHHTTRDTLGMGVFGYLSSDAEQRRALHADRSLVGAATDEWLRWDTSIVMTTRTARRATEIGRRPVEAGTRCYLHWLAANRDPDRFDHPDRFDIGRQDTKVMSFGGGMHHCLGSALARLELEEVIGEFAARYPAATLPVDPTTDIEWRSNIVFRGPLTVPVRLGGLS